MTHVLHLTRDFPPRVNGGLSTAVGGLVRALSVRGVASRVISFDGFRPKRKAGGPATVRRVHGVEVLGVGGPDQLSAIAPFLAEAPVDLVHAHDALAWQAAREACSSRPLVLSVHVAAAHVDALRGLARPTMTARVQAEAMGAAAVVTAPSRAMVEVLAAQGVEAHLAPLGIDDAAEGPAQRDPVALYVGRFGDVKGSAELLDALPRILHQAPSARVVLAGGLPDNPRGDRRWREAFEALGPRVSLAGWLDAEALDRAYRVASVLLVPSWFESFGLALREAMLRGVAPVATAVGAVPEVVEDGVTGVLVAPRAPAALADAAARLLSDEAHARRLGHAAAMRVRADSLWPGPVDALLTAYAAAT